MRLGYLDRLSVLDTLFTNWMYYYEVHVKVEPKSRIAPLTEVPTDILIHRL